MIVGIRAMARYAGVDPATVYRDYQAYILREDCLVRGGRGRPSLAFNQKTADSYRDYRKQILVGTKAKNPKHRIKIAPEIDREKAIDTAYRAGYNAGRRASQREGNAANAYRTTTGRVGAHLDGIPE